MMDQLNDLTRYSIKAASSAMSGLGSLSGLMVDIPKSIFKSSPIVPSPPPPPTPVIRSGIEQVAALFGDTSPWIRLAGLSGALAVSLGAYGAHGLVNVPEDRKSVFIQANKYHFIHTLAMLAVPMTHHPNVTGSLLVIGTCIFSGTCYCHAITGDKRVIRFTPYGGMALIFAWVSMML